jgi:hypothetical protein
VFGAGMLPASVLPGGAVPELKKSLLCINVHPFMLVYGSWIKAILLFTFVFPAVPWQIFFYLSLSEYNLPPGSWTAQAEPNPGLPRASVRRLDQHSELDCEEPGQRRRQTNVVSL